MLNLKLRCYKNCDREVALEIKDKHGTYFLCIKHAQEIISKLDIRK